MKPRNCLVLLVFLVFFVTHTKAQEKTISGTVTDNSGLPFSEVNIIVKGTTIGTQSDINGNYSIRVNTNQILRFSFIGFKTQEIIVGFEDTINVVLVQDVAQLDEVMVIGYGTQSKRKLTDNIVKLDASDIEGVPTPNLFNAIVGKAAGVQISQTNGKIESGLNFRIRGQASISAGSAPLYVLDGIPLINTLNFEEYPSNPRPRVNPLLTLSANEIESIDILKDASSAAIYGARGANGVVIITTKRGKSGKSRFNLNFSNGVSEPANKRNWLNAEQYVELILESGARSPFGDLTGFVEENFDRISNGTWRDGTYDTDWQDIALISGYIRDVNFSTSGGNDKTTFFFSGAYNDTKGIVDGNELNKFSGRLNIDHNFSNKFSLGMNIGYSRTSIDQVANDNFFTTPLQAIAQAPISPAYLDGEPFKNTYYSNYLLEDKYGFRDTKIRRITGKLFGEYKLFDWLKWNSDFAYDLYMQDRNQFRGRLTPSQSTNGLAYVSDITTENYIISNYLTFVKKFKEIHHINFVMGFELNESSGRLISVVGTEFPTDDFQTIDSAALITIGRGNTTAYSFLSYFARATYTLSDKYLFKASLRRDGSSRFGKTNQFGTFPSISMGWIMSEEDFIEKLDEISFLKLRGSWGIVGNAEIGNFASLSLFNGTSYNQKSGIVQSQAGNENLSWEESTQTEFALEYGLFNNQIFGEIAYYVKDTDGLIFNQPLIPSSGNPQGNGITKNIGRLKNNGVEFTLQTKNFETDNFTWTTDFNLAKNKTTIKELPNGEDVINSQTILREKEALNAFYLTEYAGVDPDNGDALYYINSENPDGSLNKNTTNNPNEANRIIKGQPLPEWIGGLTNTLTYKNFDLSFTFQGEWGASIYNGGGKWQSANGDWFDNQTTDQLRRWQNPGDITDVPEARLGGGNGVSNSTRYLYKADYIRLRNMMLGYNFTKPILDKMGLSQLRIYLSGLNLLTFTDFDGGYDPESRYDFGSDVVNGSTFYSAPAARTYSVGINISF